MKMSRKEAEALARLAMVDLARWADLDDKFSKLRELPEGTVIRFQKQFEPGGIVYRYAAIRVAGGRWYLTEGRKFNSPFTHDQFIQFLEDTENVEVGMSWKAIEDLEL